MGEDVRRLSPTAASRADNARSQARWQMLGLAAAAILAALVYANSLAGDFVWDDRKLIVDDRAITSWSHVSDIFSHDFFERNEDDLPYGYYRPVTTLSYLIDYGTWALRPFGYHLTNVLLHAACTVLVGLILFRLRWPWEAVAVATALFAVHPLHTENVAWIAGRTDLLAFFFAAICLLLHLSAYAPTPHYEAASDAAAGPASSARPDGILHLSVLVFALALLAKEMAVVLVAWIAIIHLIVYRRTWQRAGRAVLPYLGVVGLYAIWRFFLVNVPLPGTPEHHRPFTVLLSTPPTIVRYLSWLVLPVDLNAYVQNPYVVSPLDPRFVGATLFLSCLGWLLYRFGRHAPRLLLGAAMLAASFLPIINIVRVAAPPDMGNVMAERFCYFPSFPFLALIGLAVAGLLSRPACSPLWRRGIAATLAALVLLGTLATVRRNRVWRDDYTFLTVTLDQSPTAVLLWGNLAVHHLRKRQLDEGARALERAAALDPENYWVRSSQALWYVVSGRHAEAIPIQEEIVADAKHGQAPALNNLAYLYRVTGQEEQAMEILQKMVADGTAYGDVYFNLAEIHRHRQQPDQAREQYRLALGERPNNRPIATAWASFELENGQPQEAERIYRDLLAIYPDDARVRNNLALIRHRGGDSQTALRILSDVVAQHPSYINARINYAQILQAVGRSSEAVTELETAQRLAAGTDMEPAAARSLAEAKAAIAAGKTVAAE